MDLHAGNLRTLDAGTRILGSGGGAPSALALQLTASAWPPGATVPVIPFESVPRESWVFSAAIVGAGSMYDERPPGGTEFDQAFEDLVGLEKSISALICAEIGGINGLFIVDAARKSGLPLVDADFMGRALPRIGQFSIAVSGHSLTPAVVVLPGGETIRIDRATDESVERIVRTLLGDMGGWACIGFPPLPANQLPTTVIPGSISRALALGGWLEACADTSQGRRWPHPPDGEYLGEGRVADVSRGMPGSSTEFASTSIRCRGGEILRVDSLSEYLLVLKDGSVVAKTPDVIVLLDRVNCWPIVCGAVRVGMEVVVVRLRAPEFWRDPRHAHAVDLSAFGLSDATGMAP